MDYTVIASDGQYFDQVNVATFSLQKAISNPNSPANPEIKAGDRIYLFGQDTNRSELMQAEIQKVRQQASYTDLEMLVRANGLIRSPGQYPLVEGMRASDLVCASGGLQAEAFGLQAELSRYKVANGDRRQMKAYSSFSRATCENLSSA